MNRATLTIDGLAGPVDVSISDLTGRAEVTVGGYAARKVRRGIFLLPTADGTEVEAKVRATLFDPHPTVEINGVKHRSGPKPPVWLALVMCLPFGLALIGVIGFVANLFVIRSRLSTPVKAFLMVGILIANLLLAGTLRSAIA